MKHVYVSVGLLLINIFVIGAADRGYPMGIISTRMECDVVGLTVQLFPIPTLKKLIYDKPSEKLFNEYKEMVLTQVTDCKPFFSELDLYYKGFNLTTAILDNEKLAEQMAQLLADGTLLKGPWNSEQLDALMNERLKECDCDLRVRIRNLMYHNNEKQVWEHFANLKERTDKLPLDQRQDYLDAVEGRTDALYAMFQNRTQVYAQAQYRRDLRQSAKHVAVRVDSDEESDDTGTESEPDRETAPSSELESHDCGVQ